MLRNLLLAAIVILAANRIVYGVESVVADDVSVSTKPSARRRPDAPTLKVSQTDFTYLSFNLVDVLPEGLSSTKVAKATLRLWVEKTYVPGNASVQTVTTAWSERSIMPGNLPSEVPSGAIIFVVEGGQHYVTIDITKFVKLWIDGSVNTGVVLKGVSLSATDQTYRPAASFSIDSKENTGTGHGAELQLVLREL